MDPPSHGSVSSFVAGNNESWINEQYSYSNLHPSQSPVDTSEPIHLDDDFDDPNSTNPSEATGSTSKKRKKPSKVWDVFDKDEVKEQATCRICKHVLDHKNKTGTCTLTRHLNNKHPGWKDHVDPLTQQCLQRSGTGNVENWRFNHLRARENTARYVVQCELPFSYASSELHERYMRESFQPQFKRIPRQTCYNDGMRLFQKDVEKMQAVFESLTCKFSLTSDLWTGRSGISYMCVTAHWIDENWILQKRIIEFAELEHPHTGVALHSEMMKCINFWKLKEKVMTMSFDNASNNLVAVRMLSTSLNPILKNELFHVGCVCHIIHLCVKDGLKCIVGPVEKIRSCLKHIITSTSRVQGYRELIENNSKKFRYPYLDCKIRWNSTFRMLQECREFGHEIVEFCSGFKLDNSDDVSENYLTWQDFEVIDILGPFLQIFKNVTETMSGQFYPTANLMLLHMVQISELFKDNKDNGSLGDVITGMLNKWLKYYTKVPTLAILAAALDPRCKIEGCLSMMQIYYTNVGKEFDEKKEKYQIYQWFEKLYDSYNDALTSKEASSRPADQSKGKGMFSSFLGKSKMTRPTPSDDASINEVAYYFGKNPVDDEGDFDILKWWNTDARSFPILRRIARDLLATQMSTVASESCFSVAGRTLSDKRSRLTPKSIRFCVMWKDMLDAEHRTKELRRIKPEIEEEDHPLIRGFLAKDEDLIPEEEVVEPEIGTSASQLKFNWLSKYDFIGF